MSVSLGEFTELDLNLDSDEVIMVVDTTESVLEDQRLRGLLLHHPRMKMTKDSKPIAIDDALLSEVIAIRDQARSALADSDRKSRGFPSELLKRFRDPLPDGDHSEWTAAFAPIMVYGRPIEIADTGWGVIVAERD